MRVERIYWWGAAAPSYDRYLPCIIKDIAQQAYALVFRYTLQMRQTPVSDNADGNVPAPVRCLALGAEVFSQSKAREDVVFNRSFQVLKLCSQALANSPTTEKRYALTATLIKTFDAELVPSALVRSALASVLVREAPEVLLENLALFQLAGRETNVFSAERLTWCAPRAVAREFMHVVRILDVPETSYSRLFSIAATRDPAGSIEYVPRYPIANAEILYDLLCVYISRDASSVASIVSSLRPRLGTEPGESHRRMLDLASHTITAGGAQTFLYFIREFFGVCNLLRTPDVARVVDGALATESGKHFFFEHYASGRIVRELLEYVEGSYKLSLSDRALIKNVG